MKTFSVEIKGTSLGNVTAYDTMDLQSKVDSLLCDHFQVEEVYFEETNDSLFNADTICFEVSTDTEEYEVYCTEVDSYEEELARVCAYIYHYAPSFTESSTFMQSFDKAKGIAEDFIAKYPVSTDWGDMEQDWDEALEAFILENC